MLKKSCFWEISHGISKTNFKEHHNFRLNYRYFTVIPQTCSLIKVHLIAKTDARTSSQCQIFFVQVIEYYLHFEFCIMLIWQNYPQVELLIPITEFWMFHHANSVNKSRRPFSAEFWIRIFRQVLNLEKNFILAAKLSNQSHTNRIHFSESKTFWTTRPWS